MLHPTSIVTGANRGLGKSIAMHLARSGYKVGLLGRDCNQLRQVRSDIINENHLSHYLAPIVLIADITDETQVLEAVDTFVTATGRLDVLVNNAGIFLNGTLNLSSDDLKKLLDVNLLGAFHCIKAVAQIMKSQKTGYIFNIASMSSKDGYLDLGGYSASKYALLGMCTSIMKDLIQYNIKVTNICPGLIATEMTENIAVIPFEKMIPVDDIALCIEYLLKLSSLTMIKDIEIECTEVVKFQSGKK